MELTSIEYITRKRLPWNDMTLIPLGDIQLQQDKNAVDVRRLKETIQWGVDHDAYWIGMGDFIDLESPSNRRALAHSGVYDSVIDALDAKAEELEEQLMDWLKPTVGRWLGVLEGHHFHEHQDGSTTDTRFAQFLKCPFLGTSAYVNIAFEAPAKGYVSPSFNIWAHHGRGGGSLAGSPSNIIEKMMLGFDADLYLMAHTHTLGHVPRDRVYPIWGRTQGSLNHKTVHLVSTGAYLKGFEERSRRNGRAGGGYAEKAMMRPLSLGSPKIHFRPRWRKDEVYKNHGAPVVDISVEV